MSSKTLTQVQKDEIVAQSIKEIQFSRRYKQGKIRNWQRNEQMYYAKKLDNIESRSNVDLGRMQEFVHTLLSKIDTPLEFKFQKRKESQSRRVKYLNALRKVDQGKDYWDMKDLVGKKQAIIYGRAAYCYYADSINGYKSHLENIDVYDLLVDPSGGGIDVELMRYWGRYGVIKTRDELEYGKNEGIYDKANTEALLSGVANNTESTQEQTNKTVRMFGQNTIGLNELQSEDKFKFWDWYTTYKGRRYNILMQELAGRAISITPLDEIFTATKEYPLAQWPLWTWAAFPDLTEFWTPSYADYVREIFQIQHVNINQMLDNSEAINKPQKVVDTGAFENLAELKYRRDGLIKVKAGFDVNKAYQTIQPPQITTPITVFNVLEGIQEKASGVTAQVKGQAQEDGKVGIYEGNQEASAERFGLLNRSYAFGYKRFARLYEAGVRDHMIRKIAVDMIGEDGIETSEISRKDIFKKGDDFNVAVEASDAEMNVSAGQQKAKLDFLNMKLQFQLTNPLAPKLINEKKAFEIQASVAGFSDDEIKELMDVSEYGNGDMMAEASEDIEELLNGEDITPNPGANNAYRQKIVDYMVENQDDMSAEDFIRFAKYTQALEPIVIKNMARQLMLEQTNALATQPTQLSQAPQAPQVPQAMQTPQMPMNGQAPMVNNNPVQ